MIKAITFDLDGVYFINGKSNFILNVVKMGIPEEEATRVFLKSNEMNTLYKTGKMSDNEFWTWAANEWKIKSPPEKLIQLLIDGYEINPKVVETVKKVRAKGLKTLICSNNFPARINGLQKKFGFLSDFDAWALSYEVGATKPDHKIFQELIRRSNVSPEQIVFSDDNEANLSGASELGINAFYFEGFDKFIEKLKDLGVVI